MVAYCATTKCDSSKLFSGYFFFLHLKKRGSGFALGRHETSHFDPLKTAVFDRISYSVCFLLFLVQYIFFVLVFFSFLCVYTVQIRALFTVIVSISLCLSTPGLLKWWALHTGRLKTLSKNNNSTILQVRKYIWSLLLLNREMLLLRTILYHRSSSYLCRTCFILFPFLRAVPTLNTKVEEKLSAPSLLVYCTVLDQFGRLTFLIFRPFICSSCLT